MKTFQFTALAAVLLLQSLTYADNAPSNKPVSGNPGSVALSGGRHDSGHAAEGGDYFPLPDVNDRHNAECDPEDDCPRQPHSAVWSSIEMKRTVLAN